jgi:hypothetical protein
VRRGNAFWWTTCSRSFRWIVVRRKHVARAQAEPHLRVRRRDARGLPPRIQRRGHYSVPTQRRRVVFPRNCVEQIGVGKEIVPRLSASKAESTEYYDPMVGSYSDDRRSWGTPPCRSFLAIANRSTRTPLFVHRERAMLSIGEGSAGWTSRRPAASCRRGSW